MNAVNTILLKLAFRTEQDNSLGWPQWSTEAIKQEYASVIWPQMYFL